MSRKEALKIFENKNVRLVWDDEQEKWYFSIVDVCGILTEQPDYDHAKNYWKVLKFRLIKEGNKSVTNCNQLKLASPKDGKRYSTDVADIEQLFRIIQSSPSPKAEPFKCWMAQVAAERLDQMQDPELSIEQARRGGHVAKAARNQLESQLGHSVVTRLNAKDYLLSIGEAKQQQIDDNSKNT